MPKGHPVQKIRKCCAFCGNYFLAKPHKVKIGRAKYCSNPCKNNSRKKPLSERFWEHVVKSDGCWEWNGGKAVHGYGSIHDDNGHQLRSNQASWILHHGPIPEGLWILHKCDNPPCVRPDHLYLGTHQDNMRDLILRGKGKGAAMVGSKNVHAKLREKDIPMIYKLNELGISYTAIGRMFRVKRNAIKSIIIGKSWKQAF